MKEAIKVKSEEHGKKVVDYLNRNKSNVVVEGKLIGYYYFVDEDGEVDFRKYLPSGYTETFLPEEYPKEMWVWDNNEMYKTKQIVYGEFMGQYMTREEDDDDDVWYLSYKNAEAIEEEKEETDPLLEAYTEYSKSTDRCVNNCFDVYKAGYKKRMEEEAELLSTVKPI